MAHGQLGQIDQFLRPLYWISTYFDAHFMRYSMIFISDYTGIGFFQRHIRRAYIDYCFQFQAPIIKNQSVFLHMAQEISRICDNIGPYDTYLSPHVTYEPDFRASLVMLSEFSGTVALASIKSKPTSNALSNSTSNHACYSKNRFPAAYQ